MGVGDVEILLLCELDAAVMSAAAESEIDMMQRCASCGITGGDDIKLKRCTACHLVKYCSVKCQKDHRKQHKKECKKRAAELHDEILFKQPEGTHLGDCPICCLPVPIDTSTVGKSVFMTCCSKRVCVGCNLANKRRETEERQEHKCPFCRKVMPTTEEEINERLIMRIEANDPVAMCSMGKEKYVGGDYKAAFDYLTRAVALGNVDAHYQLSILYHNGEGVEKDEKKELHHCTEAAIGGHSKARQILGCMEGMNGRMERAVKHWIIAAKLGDDVSLKFVKDLYKRGSVSKEDLDAALRGYQTAINAMKSPQREEAEKYPWFEERKRLGLPTNS